MQGIAEIAFGVLWTFLVPLFEAVQRRLTPLIPGMKGRSYKERLYRLGLYPLEFRRMRGDLIETCKILRRFSLMGKKQRT